MSAIIASVETGTPGSPERADYLVKQYSFLWPDHCSNSNCSQPSPRRFHMNQTKTGSRIYRCVCKKTSLNVNLVLSQLEPLVDAYLAKGQAAATGSIFTQPSQILFSAPARRTSPNLTVADPVSPTVTDGSVIPVLPSDTDPNHLPSATPVPPSQTSPLFVGPSPNYGQYTSPAPGPTPSFGATPALPSNFFSASPKLNLPNSGANGQIRWKWI
ncbi:hypothetical protein BGZ54_004247 [Gamsiella multidivaricata]|nr:hypothetical protein BGZ54_004247 [Gamsiella multidivaricata]